MLPVIKPVYRILAHSTHDATWPEAIKNRFDFERDIALLAKKTGIVIHFHQYRNPSQIAHNETHILLECPQAFLEEIKKLPAFASIYQLNTGRIFIETLRRKDAPQIEPPEARMPPKHNGGINP